MKQRFVLGLLLFVEHVREPETALSEELRLLL
jgi:hypothetical protein